MTERLEGLYSSDGHQCGCGGDSPSTGAQIARLAKSGDKDKHTPPEPRPSVSKKAYRWVYKAGGMKPEMLSDRPIRKMIEETSSSLSTALDEDIAQELTPEMRNALERDVFLFSGFKTYHNLKEASLLLENKERGGIQTFDEFYRSIRQIDDKYNRDWLRSEYQFAVNSAAMASQWEQALKDKDLYALQYVTVGDDRVRPEHAELDGLVLPMDDPFWRTGTPPNGWGCRCTVMQVPLEENPLTPQEQSDRSRAASAALNDMTEGKNSIFRFNPYYDQALFPPKHPYFGKKGYRHCSSDRLAADRDPECAIYKYIMRTRNFGKDGYTTIKTKDGELKIHKDADPYDFKDNVRIGKILVGLYYGGDIRIREHKYIEGVANPEFFINKILADAKGIEGYKGISSGFKKAKHQGCGIVIIDFDKHFSGKTINTDQLIKKLKHRHLDFENGIIEEVVIIHNKKGLRISADKYNDENWIREEMQKGGL